MLFFIQFRETYNKHEDYNSSALKFDYKHIENIYCLRY